MGLLTAGVLGFQAIILASMLLAACSSRGALNVATAAWVAFTLFGSIFTAGLLLLQLFTVALGYVWGSALVPMSTNQTKWTLGQVAVRAWDFIRITIIACVVIGWIASEQFK